MATPIYVNPDTGNDGNDGNDGEIEGNAKKSIQAAVGVVDAGGKI